MVQITCNVALTREERFACDFKLPEKRHGSCFTLSIHLCKYFSNTHKQKRCHDLLLGNYLIVSKSTCACECDVALDLYRKLVLAIHNVTHIIRVRSVCFHD